MIRRGFVIAVMTLACLADALAKQPADPLARLVLEERFSDALGVSVDELQRSLDAKGWSDAATLAALNRVGEIAHLAGDQSTAGDVLRAVLGARRRLGPGNDPMVVKTLIDLGRSARYRNEREAARRYYDEAGALLGTIGNAPELRALLAQADADWLRGVDLNKAIAAYRTGLAIRGSASGEPGIAFVDNQTWLAWTLMRAGERAEARVLARQAKRQLVRMGLASHSLRGVLDNMLGEDLVLDGKLAEAVPLFKATAATAEAVRRKQPGGYSRRGYPLDGYDPLALDALAAGRPDEAWELMERARAASHVDFATLALWSRRDPATWVTWRGLHDELKAAKRRLAAASDGRSEWTERTAGLFVAMLDLRARTYELERRYLNAERPAAPALEAVRALLHPDDALVGWLDVNFGGDYSATTAPQRTRGWAYVLRKDRPIAWVSLWDARTPADAKALSKDMKSVFEALRRAASWRRRVDPDPEIAPQMRAWSRLMVDRMLPQLDGVRHVISERMLDPLELAVLPDGRTFGDTFEVSYVPSALVLELLAEKGASPPRPPSVLAVSGRSEPPPDGTTVASLVNVSEASRSQRLLRNTYRRDDTRLDQLPKLRYAALEALAVGTHFPRHRVLIDPETADRELNQLADRNGLRAFSVLHFAAHTLTDNAPERCALALGNGAASADPADGLVEVDDIMLGWELDAELLTLSGCETLRAAGAGRGEPLGFTPALFASGARRVLSSIWTVDDRATTMLMDRFYENLARGAAPPGALHEAKVYVRTLKDASGRRPFEHPAYWAGFLLVGLP